MKTRTQRMNPGNPVVITTLGGKYKIRVLRLLKEQIPDELIKNVLLKIS